MANYLEKQRKGLADYLQRHGFHIETDDPRPVDNWYEWEKM